VPTCCEFRKPAPHRCTECVCAVTGFPSLPFILICFMKKNSERIIFVGSHCRELYHFFQEGCQHYPEPEHGLRTSQGELSTPSLHTTAFRSRSLPLLSRFLFPPFTHFFRKTKHRLGISRPHSVHIGGESVNDLKDVFLGAPQGSILGLILFLI